uniref:Ubiquitin domain containing 1 n=1 Tax=Fundulus heteroclitus TaxID=8078 RepID=A0A3Q2STL3_FUNHE
MSNTARFCFREGRASDGQPDGLHRRAEEAAGETGGHRARNEPLKKERPKWKSEYPMTEGQLRSKRDEFWDTAPAFDGRKEIWDALRAAALALECNDLELAQAIVDGACITLPHGSLTESYDELGNRYQLPAYTLAPPLNLITETSGESKLSESAQKQVQAPVCREEFQLRVRLSTGNERFFPFWIRMEEIFSLPDFVFTSMLYPSIHKSVTISPFTMLLSGTLHISMFLYNFLWYNHGEHLYLWCIIDKIN